MTVDELTMELINATDTPKTWYAVHRWVGENEDGNGSYNAREAAEYAIEEKAWEVALIYDDGMDNCYATVTVNPERLDEEINK